MTTIALIAELRAQKVELWAEQGKLHFRAPPGVLTTEHRERLKLAKAEILALLASETAASPAPDDDQPFALTAVQSAYLAGRHSSYGYGGTGCHGYFEIDFPDLDRAGVERAWNQLIARHGMLRAVIDPRGEQRIQAEVATYAVDEHDWRERDPAKQMQALAALRERLSHRHYVPDQWPLFSVELSQAPQSSRLHVSIDLLIADFASIQLLLHEFAELYERPDTTLPALGLSFPGYLQLAASSEAQRQRDREYWLARIDALPPAPALPVATDGERSRPRFERWSHTVPAAAWRRLQQHSANHELTPSAALLSAYAEVLARYSAQPRFTLNLTLMTRRPVHADVASLVGDFTQVTLLAVDSDAAPTFHQRALSLQRQLWEDMEHAHYTGVEVLRELGRRGTAALMPVVFTSTLGIAGAETNAALLSAGELAFGISQTPQVWIDCQALERRGSLSLNWDVRADVFPAGMIEAMFDSFRGLVERLAAGPEVWSAASLTALPPEQAERRAQANACTAPLPDTLLHAAFEREAEQASAAVALIDGDRHLSYGELQARARALAHRLRAHGVQPGELVAVLMQKGWEQIVAVLGILHAGAAYVPIDAALPAARRNLMLQDAGVRCAITQVGWQPEIAPPSGIAILTVDAAAPGIMPASLPPTASTADLAYVIYTSGSTGQPKGVMISHRAAVNTVLDINRRYAIGREDRVLALASLSFDLSVYDLFGLLGAGGTLILPAAAERANPAHWARLLERHQVTVWNSVPAQMQMLVAYLASAPHRPGAALRRVLLSGDWIPPHLPEQVRALFPAAKISALGGATEAAIWSNHFDTEQTVADCPSIPYGRPLSNQRFHVLNARFEDAPDWVPGELYIGGSGLAEGYWNDPARTGEGFIHRPGTNERLYRTGDLGRYRPDGNLEFLGRLDHQVKLRGHRIELAEIDAALQEQADIETAVTRIDAGRLIAHLLPKASVADPGQAALAQAAVVSACEQATRAAGHIDGAAVQALLAAADRVSLARMQQALVEVDALRPGDAPQDLDALIRRGRIAPDLAPLIQRWLNALAGTGRLQRHGANQYLLPGDAMVPATADDEREIERLQTQLDYSAELLQLLQTSQTALPQLLRGEADPLALLYPEGRLDVAMAAYRDNLASRTLNGFVSAALLALQRAAGRPLRILEIGAGVGGTTDTLIAALADAGAEVEYWFTDTSVFFLHAARERYRAHPFVRYALFDLDLDSHLQDIPPHSFDVVIAANMLHSVRNLDHACRRCSDLLSAGGWLLMVDLTRPNYPLLCSLEFLEGMRHFDDERGVSNEPFLSVEQWQHKFTAIGASSVLALPGADHPLAPVGQSFLAFRVDRSRVLPDLQAVEAALRARLPEIMIPNQFHLLEYLPLSDNGKVERRVLPTPQPHPEHGTAGEAASSPLEIKLAQVWCEVLGLASVGRHQNFFQLGGDSLLIAQMIGRLRDALGHERVQWDTTLRHFAGHATIAELAAHLESQAAQAATPALPGSVLLREGGAPPLFLFHDGIGNLLPYQPLLRQLPAGMAVRGFAVTAVDAFLDLPADGLISTLAERYAEAIAAEQPDGPLRLAGYCMGGLITLEVARVLRGRGRELTMVAAISAYQVPYRLEDACLAEYAFARALGIAPQDCSLPADEQAAGAALQAALKARPTALSIAAMPRNGPLAQVAATFERYLELDQEARLARLWHAYSAAGNRFSLPDQDAFAKLFQLFHHSLEAVMRYRPEAYAGDVVFFRQTGDTHFLPGLRDDMTRFWRETCLGEVDVRDLSGDHFECLNDPVLAQHLAALLCEETSA